jgi:hypothetical protein
MLKTLTTSFRQSTNQFITISIYRFCPGEARVYFTNCALYASNIFLFSKEKSQPMDPTFRNLSCVRSYFEAALLKKSVLKYKADRQLLTIFCFAASESR